MPGDRSVGNQSRPAGVLMSGMTEHPELLLSAYLDDALAPDEHAAVRLHLESCAACDRKLDARVLMAVARTIRVLVVNEDMGL